MSQRGKEMGEKMEEKDEIIARLKGEIKALNKDIHLAATYGKQLFEEKAQLSVKVEDLLNQKEVLEQEKHTLQLDLETKIQALNSETNEVEWQKEKANSLSENLQKSEKDAELLKKKHENLVKENQDLKKVQEDLLVENKSLLSKIDLLEKQMKNFEEQVEKSMCEVERNEIQDIQAQLNVYMLNNKDLQVALSQTQCELEIAKKNENHLLQMVRDLEETVREKSSDISTYHAEAKKAREDIEELQAEIEVLKFDQIDVNRRGNSVFAELDDRRHLVEREYKTLRKKYDLLKKDYDENMKEVDKLRGQTAILQSMTSRSYQQAYIDQLEDSLSTARREIKDLMHKLSKALKDSDGICLEKAYCQKRGYDYLRVMLDQSRQRVKELQNENTSLLTQSMYDNDKVIKTQHLLYKSKEDLDSASQEIVQLKLKIKELEQGIMHSLPTEKEPAKPRIEYLDGFKPLDNGKENELLNKSKLDPFADLDIIPGEIELGEDGFKETRRPRKSNRFKLQEFNRIKSDEEENVSEPNASVVCKKTERISETSAKEKICDETETEKPKVRSYPKTAPRRRDECKQQ